MRALLQRVSHAAVEIDGVETASINAGMLVLLGVARDDTPEAAAYLASRTANLRIFDDADGVPNISLKDSGGQALVVSQFTLYANTRKGNRPSYIDAAPPEIAEPLYNVFVEQLRVAIGASRVKTGTFRAMMNVTLTNAGPFTVTLESDRASSRSEE